MSGPGAPNLAIAGAAAGFKAYFALKVNTVFES